eukprot:1147704-Pelagomonas_calceolata.AAC.3
MLLAIGLELACCLHGCWTDARKQSSTADFLLQRLGELTHIKIQQDGVTTNTKRSRNTALTRPITSINTIVQLTCSMLSSQQTLAMTY